MTGPTCQSDGLIRSNYRILLLNANDNNYDNNKTLSEAVNIWGNMERNKKRGENNIYEKKNEK